MKRFIYVVLLSVSVMLLVACSSQDMTRDYPNPYEHVKSKPLMPSNENEVIVHTYDDAKPDAILSETYENKHMPQVRVERIALLLPVTGQMAEMGRAVQDGVYAAYKSDNQIPQPVIHVYDTQSDMQVLKAYDQAVADGAAIVVGPLTKSGLEQLEKKKKLSVPVLALNYHLGYSKKNLYQFGLAPEDEVRQAVIQAKLDGHSSALLMVPDTAWGRRMANTFTQQWSAQGGYTVDTVYFNEYQNFSPIVKQALKVRENAESEEQPTSRQDIDIIFLAASPNQARQIKPLFAFYYASHIPVYSTSSIYTGVSNSVSDSDLNDIIFCDVPWVLALSSKQQALNEKLQRLSPVYSNRYTRLYALGIDAYELIDYLPALKSQVNYPFKGVTGHLTLNRDARITRYLPCAQFKQGQAQIVSKPQMF